MDTGFERFCLALGKRVRDLRLRRGMTQEDMLDHGFVVRHYQRIEAGRSITLATIWKLARAFRVAPREILPKRYGSQISSRTFSPGPKMRGNRSRR